MAKAYKWRPMEGVIASWYANNTAADLAVRGALTR